MELFFLIVLVVIMAIALGSGFPVAFALPGSAIITITLAAAAGYLTLGDTSAFFHSGGPYEWVSAGVLNLRGVYWEVERDTLIAIPLFIFMGIMLQRSKIAEDLLVTMAQLFGPVPGGLGISVVFVGALLAATTGIVGATVVAMGLISLPAMLRNNYSKSLATGTICASGTLGQIIPPSIVLIILADQLASAADQAATMRKDLYKQATGQFSMPSEFNIISTSAGDMFLGAFLPGIILVALYMAYILIAALIRPKIAPAVPYDGKLLERSFLLKVALALVPPLLLIFLVLGSIIAGIATVNQAGAIGAVGALIMAGYKLHEGSKSAFYPSILTIVSLLFIWLIKTNFNLSIKTVTDPSDWFGVFFVTLAVIGLCTGIAWSGWRAFKIEDTLREVMSETAKTTSLVFIILLGAAMLTAAFRGFGGEEIVKHFLSSLPGGFWTQFVVVMLVIFVLGFFLDFIEIAVVVVPIVAPILLADPSANVTAVWLGVMIGLNIQTSFLTPPFGFALFYLRGVAPAIVKTVQMYKGVIPFITLQLLALAVVGLYPSLVNYLPNRVSFLSETSPPPKNPKLQYCIEEYVRENVLTDNNDVKNAIFKASEIDRETLPKSYQLLLTKSISDVTKGIEHLSQAFNIEKEINKKSLDYEPQLLFVRNIEKDIRSIEKETKEIKVLISRLSTNQDDEEKILQKKLIAKNTLIEKYRSQIPKDWPSRYKEFQSLIKKEKIERSKYRRLMDGSYNEIFKLYSVISLKDMFFKFETKFNIISTKLETSDPSELIKEIKLLTRELSKIPDNRNIISSLNKSVRNLKKKKVDYVKIKKDFETAYMLYVQKSNDLKVIDNRV